MLLLKLCFLCRGLIQCAAKSSKNNTELCILYIVIYLSLLIAGDVELNPGPTQNFAHTLSILHCNIRSIRHKLDYIRDHFSDFNVLCFTETHLNEDISNDAILLQSYDTPYRKDRTNHGGGILVYLNEDIIHERVTDLEVYCDESIWVKVKLKTESLLIGVFYSPRTADADFFYKMNINLEKAIEITKNIVIVGDMNENLLNPHFNHLKNVMIMNDLQNVINTPTRQDAILDPILIPTDMDFSEAGVEEVPSFISDHKGTFLQIPFYYNLHSTYVRTVWLYKKANFTQLNDKINRFDWSILHNGSVQDACSKFTDVFIQLVKSVVPFKSVYIRPNDKPWYDNEIRKYSRKRDRMKTTAIKSRKDRDWSRYKQLRNKVNNLKKQAKETFFTNLETNLTDLQTNDKKGFWKIIRHFIKQNDCSSNIPPLASTDMNGNTKFFTSNEEKANCLNNYFCSISTVTDENATLPNFYYKTQSRLSQIPISRNEIEELIMNLNVNKASGPDMISHKMLKECVKSVSYPLHILFTRSFEESVFPDQWKIAQVMPIFKKGDKAIASNYRPVSLLSCCGKLFERIIFKYTFNYLLENNLIYKYQSGFLPNHSTIYQLIDIYHHICQSFDNKQYSCMIFCDISKAFDRVWHKGLLFKLQQSGIEGKLLKWISSYLQNRQQRTVIQSTSSSLKNISAGVPQGSVLGPLLFLIYVDDITETLLSLTRLYADDSSLYCSASSIQDIEGLLNHDLAQISAWAKQWQVAFNPSKTEALFFSLRNIDTLPKLTFNGTDISFVDNHKHLGLTLSSDGHWSSHIENILKSASRIISIMRKLKFEISRSALNQIYVSYVRPLLEYASVVWDGCSNTDADSLEKIQNEAARIVTGLTRSVSLNNLYDECCWEPLAKRREKQKLYFMYKAKNNMLPSYINDLIPPNVGEITDYPLRNREDVSNIHTRTATFQKSCIPSSINLWNSVDVNIRANPTLNSFKCDIQTLSNLKKVPSHYLHGNRFLSVMHARIRNGCSNLNEDLFNNHLRPNPVCFCNVSNENAYHYFFSCNYYRNQREELFRSTRNYHPLSIDKLIYGDNSLTPEDNLIIFSAVQQFIKSTKRFDNT